MRNSFFLPYFAAAESHELTHLLSSSCPWGKHVPFTLQPQGYCSHLAQRRLLLSQLGPHFSITSQCPRPSCSHLSQGPSDCDKTLSCCIKSGLRRATDSLGGGGGGRAFCLPKLLPQLSSQRGFSSCGEDTAEGRTVILKNKEKQQQKKRVLQFF